MLFFTNYISIIIPNSGYLRTEGINPELKSAVDQDLYLKILEHGNPSFINENLYYYRLHANGLSQQNAKQTAKDSFATVIYDTMLRRKIKNINGEKVPDKYTNSEDIYKLLEYQTTFLFRIRNRLKLIVLS